MNFSFLLNILCAFLWVFSVQAKEIRYAIPGEVSSLDPAVVTDIESMTVSDTIFDNLIQLKPGSFEFEEGLAESWEVNARMDEYTFKIRKGVSFHDGSPLNSDAVIFSFLRQHDPKHEAHKYGKWHYWRGLGMNTLVKKVFKKDNHTVVFQLSRPEATFLANLTMPFSSIVSPKAVRKYKDKFGQNPVGSGPFKFSKWETGRSINVNKNVKYWGKKAIVNGVQFRVLKRTEGFQELLAKNVDIVPWFTSEGLDLVKQEQKSLKVLKGVGANICYIAFNTNKKPFNNVDFRKALTLGLNVGKIIKEAYRGTGQRASTILAPSIMGFNENIKPYKYNLAEAKKSLIKSGIEEGFSFNFYTIPIPRSYIPNPDKVTKIIVESWEALGLKPNVVKLPWKEYLEKRRYGIHDVTLGGWVSDNGDPDNTIYTLLHGNNAVPPATNPSFWSHKGVNKLLQEAKAIPWPQERIAKYKKAQEIIHSEYPVIPIAHTNLFVSMSKKIKGFVVDSMDKRRFELLDLKD